MRPRAHDAEADVVVGAADGVDGAATGGVPVVSSNCGGGGSGAVGMRLRRRTWMMMIMMMVGMGWCRRQVL